MLGRECARIGAQRVSIRLLGFAWRPHAGDTSVCARRAAPPAKPAERRSARREGVVAAVATPRASQCGTLRHWVRACRTGLQWLRAACYCVLARTCKIGSPTRPAPLLATSTASAQLAPRFVCLPHRVHSRAPRTRFPRCCVATVTVRRAGRHNGTRRPLGVGAGARVASYPRHRSGSSLRSAPRHSVSRPPTRLHRCCSRVRAAS